MRHFLISALLLSLVAGCSSLNIGPHRIDVQQGNALDQENVSRLKTGLNRSQVRFLLGTPLLVDPFRSDRWDYVYVDYKAGKLAEQKHISLFFEGDTLVRIEGDLPAAAPSVEPAPAVIKPESKVETMALPLAAESRPTAEPLAARPAPVDVPAQAELAPTGVTAPDLAATSASAVAATATPESVIATAVESAPQAVRSSGTESSIVAALPGPASAAATTVVAPVMAASAARADLKLQSENDAERIKPDAMPSDIDVKPVADASDAPVIKALNDWAKAWSLRDDDGYIASYDASFVPEGGDSHADWEKRRRLLLNVAKNIELKISSPSVHWADDGSATVTFNQFYRSENYRDAVVKQLRMAESNGRWLIVEEKVLSMLKTAKP